MYAKMPFGLMNAGATFQRAMDIAFSDENDKILVIYLDDITIFLTQIRITWSIYKESSTNAGSMVFL